MLVCTCVHTCVYRQAGLQAYSVAKVRGPSTPKPASLHFLKSPGPALMH